MVSTWSNAQTVDKIIARYYETTGGEKAWNKVESMEVIGTVKLVTQNLELPFYRLMLKDGRQISSVKIQGTSYVDKAYDGQTVWGSNQMMQPEEKDAETRENLMRSIKEFPFPLFNYKKNGFEAELLGKDTIGDTETFKIKLTKDPILVNGAEKENVTFFYIDTQHYFLVLTETMQWSGPYQGKNMRATLEGYLEVDGYWYPFISKIKYGDALFQVMTAETVNFNIKIEEDLFKYPNTKND